MKNRKSRMRYLVMSCGLIAAVLLPASALSAPQGDDEVGGLKTTRLFGANAPFGELSEEPPESIDGNSTLADALVEAIEFAASGECSIEPPPAPQGDSDWLKELANDLRDRIRSGEVNVGVFKAERYREMKNLESDDELPSGLADENTIAISDDSLRHFRKAKPQPGMLWNKPTRVPPKELVSVAATLLHEYIHFDELSEGEDGSECELNGGNPDGHEDLTDMNPCDCAHAYVYARELRMVLQYSCLLERVNNDDDDDNDRGRVPGLDSVYESIHGRWMEYRESCENQFLNGDPSMPLTPEPRTGPDAWMFHPASNQFPNGFPETINAD